MRVSSSVAMRGMDQLALVQQHQEPNAVKREAVRQRVAARQRHIVDPGPAGLGREAGRVEGPPVDVELVAGAPDALDRLVRAPVMPARASAARAHQAIGERRSEAAPLAGGGRAARCE